MMKLLSVVVTVSLSVVLPPVWAFDVLGKVSLDPVEKPASPSFVAGTQRHWLRDGAESVTTYDSLDGNNYSATDSSGCSWTNLVLEFAPSFEWNNCSGSSGTQKITKTKGSPWPLSAKSKFQYGFRGKSNDGGKPWTSTRKCKVKAQERVRVPAGEFDTFKVECTDKWSKRTYWFSPQLGHAVAFKRKHNTDSSRSYSMEFVKTVNP